MTQPILHISLEGDGAWPDLAAREIVEGQWTRINILPHGMASGRPSIGIVVELPDGRACFAETSWRLLHAAVKAMEARYGEPT
jgi:hypothetical protein